MGLGGDAELMRGRRPSLTTQMLTREFVSILAYSSRVVRSKPYGSEQVFVWFSVSEESLSLYLDAFSHGFCLPVVRGLMNVGGGFFLDQSLPAPPEPRGKLMFVDSDEEHFDERRLRLVKYYSLERDLYDFSLDGLVPAGPKQLELPL